MKMNAAVLWGIDEPWSVEEVELDPPAEREVLVSFEATGLCHSDHHFRTGDCPGALPLIGGHEGAGIVAEVGPGVRDLAPGDHVVASFIPACGRCRWCSTGRQNLCDMGAILMAGTQVDGTFRRHARGHDVATVLSLGTFAPYGTVHENSLIKIDEDLPLNRALSHRLRDHHRLGLGGQQRRSTPRRHRRGDRLRRRRRRCAARCAPSRSGEDHCRRHRGIQARQGFPVRRHPFQRLHDRSLAVDRRVDARRDGRLGDLDGRTRRWSDDRRSARAHP